MNGEETSGGPAGPAVLLLTGGASVRAGEPKALRRFRGVPVLLGMARLAGALGYSPVLAVTGAHSALIASVVGNAPGLGLLAFPGWAQGRTATIQAGLRALEPARTVLLWPVDHPFVQARTLRALVRAGDSDELATLVVPTFAGRGGHPVLLKTDAVREAMTLGAWEPLRALAARLGPQVRRLPVDDPGVVDNLDEPERYEEAIRRMAEEGREPWTAD